MTATSTSINRQPSPERSVAEVHAERLSELRLKVFALQDLGAQLDRMQSAVTEYAKEHYSRAPEALEQIVCHIDHIFSGNGVERNLRVPRDLEALLASKPCMLTAFPGLGTHRSIALGEIVLTDRYSTVASRRQVSLESDLVRGGNFHQRAPIVLAPMRSVIGEEMIEAALAEGITPVMHRFRRPLNPSDVDSSSPTVESKEDADRHKLRLVERFGPQIFMSCGTSWESINFAKKMMLHGAAGICVDVALGNSASCAATLIELSQFAERKRLSTRFMAGNVDTEEGYFVLALAGAHIIKVGIGPGSACTTRAVTRAGAGQGSALMSAAKAKFIFGPDAPGFISDGGIKSAADVLISLALGAQSVMIGNLAARCEESGGQKRKVDGEPHVWYHGEASQWARIYEEGAVRPGMAVEGDARWLPVRGKLSDLVQEISGGLRNAFPYYNAYDIADLQRKFSIEQQFCDLILGQTTGLYVVATSHAAESRAHFNRTNP